MLAVRILGCSGSYAAAGGACSGYLVQSSQTNVWLDAGPGTLANLQRYLTLEEVDAIVLTHAHADHWLELPTVATALEWFIDRDRLPVYSNAHMFAEARQLLGESLAIAFEWHVVDVDDRIEIGDQSWSFAETDHFVPTLATRTDADGASIVFSADTGPAFSLTSLIGDRGPIDLALVESTFLERAGNEGNLHLSAAEAADLASEANVGRLILTHQAPREDRMAHLQVVESRFGGPVVLAEVGAQYAAAGD